MCTSMPCQPHMSHEDKEGSGGGRNRRREKHLFSATKLTLIHVLMHTNSHTHVESRNNYNEPLPSFHDTNPVSQCLNLVFARHQKIAPPVHTVV